MPAMDTGDRASIDIREIAAQLKDHLSQPVRTIGHGEPWSPEYDVIEAFRRLRHPAVEMSELSSAATDLLQSCLAEIEDGGRAPETIALVARLGFLCTSLGLAVDGAPFFLIALSLVGASGFGRAVDPQDLFQILRAAGRSDVPRVRPDHRRLFWLALLQAPHKGIRTLSSQNLVRLDPVRALVELQDVLACEVNEALFAHELLDRLGEEQLLSLAKAALEPQGMARLGAALREAGHVNVAFALEARTSTTSRKRRPGARLDEILTSLGGGRDREDDRGLVSSMIERVGTVDGLRAATRPDTVQRFMTLGGVVIGQDYVHEVAHLKADLSPPMLAEA